MALVGPTDNEFLEADVAVPFGIGEFEIELARLARDVAIQLGQKSVKLILIEEAIVVGIA